MSLDLIKSALPEYAKDARLNLQALLGGDEVPGLSNSQVWATALSCAYALENEQLYKGIEESGFVDDQHVQAARTAASLMAMNNVYYRALPLSGDGELSKLPAKLRMNGLRSHGIAQLDFNLYSLAISVLAGCGNCIKAHIKEVKDEGLSTEGIQSVFRIASVISSVARSLRIG